MEACEFLAQAQRFEDILVNVPADKIQTDENYTAALVDACHTLGDRVASDYSLQEAINRYLATERSRNKKPRTYGELANCPVINERTITAMYEWSAGTEQSGTVQKKWFGYFRRLVAYAAEHKLCELPINLRSRLFSFDTADEIKKSPWKK